MLKIGEPAPDFKGQASNGNIVSLADYLGKKIILYFYPKDMTSGCTTEACDFRQHHSSLEDSATVVIGVSRDSMATHNKFIEKYELPFILISDPALEIIKLYDAWKEKNMYGKKSFGVERKTYLIDEDGKIQKIYSKVKVAGHVEKVLQDIAAL